jgi:hypothetical protein
MKAPINQPGEPTPALRKKRINSKQKGNTYERWLARFYREHFGFNYCRTTREVSRLLDNCGIDLSGIPHNASAKSGYRSKRPQADKIIAQIKYLLQQSFPVDDPIHGNLTFLFHRLDGHSPYHHIVSMTFDDWVRIMTIYEKFKNFKDEGKVNADGVT